MCGEGVGLLFRGFLFLPTSAESLQFVLGGVLLADAVNNIPTEYRLAFG